MGLLGASLLVVMMVVIAEAQVVFPTMKKEMECIASNGQPGFCHEFRSAKFLECSFFPSQNTRNPNVAQHLRENVCKKTAREVYFCCPSITAPPKTSCAVKKCPANALCVEGSGASGAACLCKRGYRYHGGKCLLTCQTTQCPENAQCLEGSGSTSTSCKCKNGYKSTRTACIEMRPQNTATTRFNTNNFSNQRFGSLQRSQFPAYYNPTRYQANGIIQTGKRPQ